MRDNEEGKVNEKISSPKKENKQKHFAVYLFWFAFLTSCLKPAQQPGQPLVKQTTAICIFTQLVFQSVPLLFKNVSKKGSKIVFKTKAG